MQWPLEFTENSDDDTIPWNIVSLEFPLDSDDDSIPWNFGNTELVNENDNTNIQQRSENSIDNEVDSQNGSTMNTVEEPPKKQARLQEPYGLSDGNPDDIEMLENSETDSHPGVLLLDNEQPSTSGLITNLNKDVDSNDNENMDLDDDSNQGLLIDDGQQPSTSRQAENQNENEYSTDNFTINVKRIGFKKHTKFNATDVLYNVQLNSKPGKSNVLFKTVLEGLLHSLTKILQDLKSDLTRGTDRTLYLVSQISSELFLKP